MSDYDSALAVLVRHEDGRVEVTWPDGRPRWTAITPDALEQLVEAANQARRDGAAGALDAVAQRADEGSEFGPSNCMLLARILFDVDAALRAGEDT